MKVEFGGRGYSVEMVLSVDDSEVVEIRDPRDAELVAAVVRLPGDDGGDIRVYIPEELPLPLWTEMLDHCLTYFRTVYGASS